MTKATRRSRSIFAFSYSTSNPADPLPGSNNEIDPRGVDYSLFEADDDAYGSQASTSTAAQPTRATAQDGFFTAAPSPSDPPLSAPTQLLVRLIKAEEFEAATTVLNELHTLKSPLDEPLPIFATAALWAIRNGQKKDMLSWMRLCPGYVGGTKYLSTASSANPGIQARSTANQFRKCFMTLLDSYGNDLRRLQQASMIAAQKGYWGLLQSTLAQILRFGIGHGTAGGVSNPDVAWEYFHRLVQVNVAQRGLKEKGRRQEILSATKELRALYNLGIRTLALAGKLDDAIHWANRSVAVDSPRWALAQILVVEPFTENLLMEELLKARSTYLEQARELADGLARSPTRLAKHRPISIDAVLARVEREAMFSSDDTDYADRPLSALDSALQTHLEQGDVLAAREHLLSVLRSVIRVQRGEDDAPFEPDESAQPTFDHLPSARILSDLQDMTHKLGTIAVTSSLTETDMHQPSESSLSRETFTAEEFLRPIRTRLLSVRGGKGLWETARLYGLVRKGRWRDAAHLYVGKAGFKLPSGGITTELVGVALEGLPASEQHETLDAAQRLRGKHWPSTHAVNLLLKALTNVCVEDGDFGRLQRVYGMWKKACLPGHPSDGTASDGPSSDDPSPDSPSSGISSSGISSSGISSSGISSSGIPSSDISSPSDPPWPTFPSAPSEEEDTDALVFEHWPPSQRPSSHTFDPFLRAFARLHTPSSSDSTSAAEQRTFGSSQLVLSVLRDMTHFGVRPGISSWTIALECLAREGRDRWTSTAATLARAVGINTTSLTPSHSEERTKAPLSAGRDRVESEGISARVTAPQPGFPAATLGTYTALIHALVRVPGADGGSMTQQASGVRDDLLTRTTGLDGVVLKDALEDENEGEFWRDLLQRWQTVRQIRDQGDNRRSWTAEEVLKGNRGRTLEAMMEVWSLERGAAEGEETA